MRNCFLIASFWLWFLVYNNAISAAEKVYTWIDEKGVTHITETPPPPDARLKDVLEYTPQTEEEIERVRDQQLQSQEKRAEAALIKAAEDAQRFAQEAKQVASSAESEARAAEQRAAEFKRKVGNNIRRKQLNRSTILRLESEARKAREKASQASRNAAEAEKRAQEAQKRVDKLLEDNAAAETESKSGQTSP